MTDTIGLLIIMVLLVAAATYFAPLVDTKHGRIPRWVALRGFIPSLVFVLLGLIGHDRGFSVYAYTTMWVFAIFALCLAPPISVVLWSVKKKS